jgi:RHS repeat-associated protein
VFAPFTTTAKEEILSSFPMWCADPASAACTFNVEKPHQGVAGKNPALHPGITWSNSTSALGLRGLGWENHVGSRCTGKERDSESGLDNFEARYYGSSLGRFMSPDPEQIDGFDHLSNPQSWNGYAYVHNNPLNATDPDGLDCIYIDNDSGKMTGFNSGDCDNSTEEKANSGYYVNGTVNTISTTTGDSTGVVTGFSGTGENGNLISGAFAPTPADTSGQLNPTAQAIFSQPVFGYAAGTVDLAARLEYRAASFFFPITGLLIDQVTGIDSGTSGVSAAGVSRKPGTLGEFKGADALRRENKVARDIMKELKLGPEAREAVHEALSEGAQMAGRKLTYQEGVAAVKAALGLL